MNFEKAISFILKWEGGYVCHPDDPGGETKFGISKQSYPDLDIKNLTREEAVHIYRRDYWQASGADRLPWPLALVHFDTSVNHGVGFADRLHSESAGDVARYVIARMLHYRELRTWPVHGAGWTNRMMRLLGEVLA